MRSHPMIAVAVSLLVAVALDARIALAAPNLTVNGAQRFQLIDGMGVNVNVNSWNNGELIPALDMIVNPPGATSAAPVLRVIRDPMAWVTNEADIAPLHALDPATLSRIYETPAMQDLWSTIAYLNTIGVRGNRIVLNFMGWTPTWMGGSGAFNSPSYITSGKEPEFATMVASLVYYGRRVRGLDFTSLAPMNEPDWNCLEGPCVTSTQYPIVMHAVAAELDAMGLTDVRLVGPDTGDASTGAASYISGMMGDATVAARVDHFGVHHYNGAASAGTSYPGHDYWLTETAATCSNCDQGGVPSQGEWAFSSQTAEGVLGSLQQGIAAVLIWDGCDSYYYHHNAVGTYGLLAYNPVTGVYTPRKRYFVDAQIYGFISPGAVRVAESDAIGALGAVPAFFDSSSGRITIIGQNISNGPTTISGQINNLPSPPVFAFFSTDSGSASLQRGTDIPVSSGAFTVTIPANTIFTLVSGATEALGALPDLPTSVAVSSAFPNPMIHDVAFTLSLTREDEVGVRILDIEGREVWSAPTRLYNPGRWTIGWDGRSWSGRASAGTYFARIRVGSQLFVRRFALLR